MADTKISALTDGASAQLTTDRIPVARTPYAAGDNRYLTPEYIRTATGGALAGTKETLATGTITSSTPMATWTQTWNNSGVTFTGIDITVTDTASGASSKVVSIKGGAAGSTDLMLLYKDGRFVCSSVTLDGGVVAAARYDITNYIMINGAGIQLVPQAPIAWSDNASYPNATKDIGLLRNAAGVLEVNDGSSGNYRDICVRAVRHNGQTYANLPAGVAGMTAYVTDSTTATWGATIAGGGSNKVLAFYNGTNWTVSGA